MNIRRIFTVAFSPTRTSMRVAEAISAGIGSQSGADTETVDLTYTDTPKCLPAEDAAAVVAVPVYGGHVPALASERLRRIEGNGAPVVAVTVYGNRDYEGAVRELAQLLTERGFVTVAVAAFVGEHSFSTDSTPIAAGRPDKSDIECAKQFGERVAAALKSASTPVPVDPSQLPRVHNPFGAMASLVGFVIGDTLLRRLGIARPSPAVPQTDPKACTGCGECVEGCPAGAIAAGDELHTDPSRCIRCCACVKNCPSGARTYASPVARVLSRRFSSRKEPVMLP